MGLSDKSDKKLNLSLEYVINVTYVDYQGWIGRDNKTQRWKVCLIEMMK